MKHKKGTEKNSRRKNKKRLQNFLMWFLAIVLVASMVLPAMLGFIL